MPTTPRRPAAAAAIAAVVFAAVFPTRALAAEEATVKGLTGPAAGKDVAIVDKGTIDLPAQFPAGSGLDGKILRARVLTVGPRGRVPIHSHDQRPAFTYVVSGEIVEYRSDGDGPTVRRPGDVTTDAGIGQWWQNETDAPVVLYVVDLVEVGKAPNEQ